MTTLANPHDLCARFYDVRLARVPGRLIKTTTSQIRAKLTNAPDAPTGKVIVADYMGQRLVITDAARIDQFIFRGC